MTSRSGFFTRKLHLVVIRTGEVQPPREHGMPGRSEAAPKLFPK